MMETEARLASLVAAILASHTPASVTGQAQSGGVDPAELRRIFNELETALVASDVQDNEIFNASTVALRAAFGDAFEPLRRQIADYLFPQALETLRRARND